MMVRWSTGGHSDHGAAPDQTALLLNLCVQPTHRRQLSRRLPLLLLRVGWAWGHQLFRVPHSVGGELHRDPRRRPWGGGRASWTPARMRGSSGSRSPRTSSSSSSLACVAADGGVCMCVCMCVYMRVLALRVTTTLPRRGNDTPFQGLEKNAASLSPASLES